MTETDSILDVYNDVVAFHEKGKQFSHNQGETVAYKKAMAASRFKEVEETLRLLAGKSKSEGYVPPAWFNYSNPDAMGTDETGKRRRMDIVLDIFCPKSISRLVEHREYIHSQATEFADDLLPGLEHDQVMTQEASFAPMPSYLFCQEYEKKLPEMPAQVKGTSEPGVVQKKLETLSIYRKMMHEIASILPKDISIFINPDKAGFNIVPMFMAYSIKEVRPDIKVYNRNEEFYINVSIEDKDEVRNGFVPVERDFDDLKDRPIYVLTEDIYEGKTTSELAHLLVSRGLTVKGFIGLKSDSTMTVTEYLMSTIVYQLERKSIITSDIEWLVQSLEVNHFRPFSFLNRLDTLLSTEFNKPENRQASYVFEQLTGNKPTFQQIAL